MTRSRWRLVVLGIGSGGTVVTSCGTYGEEPKVETTVPDASADDSAADGTSDVDARGDALGDGGPSATPCEQLVGASFATAEAVVTALAADAVHVYWGSSQGASRMTTNGGASELVGSGLGTCSDVVLGADFVATRFGSGSVRVKSKFDVGADAAVPNVSPNSSGLDSRSSSAFFARRVDAVFTCAGTSTSCAQILASPNVAAIVSAPGGGFDYLATGGTSASVFHCATGCTAVDAGTLLATASQTSRKIVSDDAFVYILDRSAGSVRKVTRAGGSTSDVITGLVEPIDIAADSSGRLVVATLLNGIIRGPKTGCVASPTSPGAAVGALAVSGTTVWYAEGANIKRVGP